MTRALPFALLGAAGCLPTEGFDFGLDPETQTVIYLVVQNCVSGEEAEFCGTPGGDAYLSIAGPEETAAFNVGETDRVFIGQYAQPAEVLGLPSEVQLATTECPARPFPPPLMVTRFDLKERDRMLEAMPPDRALPEFTYQSCFESGCLAFEDGVPICSAECSRDEAPELARGAPVEVADLEIEAWNVPVCDRMWFDFETRACVDPPDLCDAEGWPITAASGVFVDASAPAGGDGLTRATAFNRADQIEGAPVILLRASTFPLSLPEISWPTEIHGCWQRSVGRSRVNATLAPTNINAEVSISGVGFDNGVRITSGDCEITRGDVHGSGVEVEAGASLVLAESLVASTSTVAVRVRGRLNADRVYALRSISHVVECTSGEANLTRLFVKGPGGSGVVVRSGCALNLIDSSLDSIPGDGVAIFAATATLSGVRITAYSGAGVRMRGGRADVRTLRIDQSRGIERRPALLLDGASLTLERAVIAEVASGLVALGSELELDQVSFDSIDFEAIDLQRDTRASADAVAIAAARIGVRVESASLDGRRITIEGGEMEETEEIGLDIGSGAMVTVEDLVVRKVERGIRVAGEGACELSSALLEETGVELDGGRLQLEEAVIRPASGSAGFFFEGLGATTAEVSRTVVEGRGSDESGVALLGDADERLIALGDRLDLTGFRPFFKNLSYAVTLSQCRSPYLPHWVIPGVGVEPAAPIRWR